MRLNATHLLPELSYKSQGMWSGESRLEQRDSAEEMLFRILWLFGYGYYI